ncbi:class I SAM-dependent methyltransferase [Actinokineospora soli]|uniref:Class I SAM-dependent methyltransferase n=1 Tax=Actinokineospora soli TaxID=1048753 RepID=A0ABW2TJ01_9PSEU
MELDATGKVSLDHIYTAPDPRPYFSTLRGLGYRIPQLAKPHFTDLIRECGGRRVLDIGCSYGINAALLRCDATMDELYDRYPADDRSRDELLAADRALVRARGARGWFAGLDASRPALDYALAAGFLDEAVHADLETNEPTPAQRALFDSLDVVVSTGCVGYITEATLARVAGDRLPWMAHFVLRMFPFAPIADRLDALGYRTEVVDGLFPQRRFASDAEREQVLDTLAQVGVDPSGWETGGWMYARLHISRPRARVLR